MNHQQRVERYKRYMAEAGAKESEAAPYLWELAWSGGWEIPPPPFMGALGVAAFAAFALPVLVFGLWLLTLLRPRHHVPFAFAAWLTLAAGVFGVIAMPIYFQRMAKRYGLVRWSTFVGVRQRT